MISVVVLFFCMMEQMQNQNEVPKKLKLKAFLKAVFTFKVWATVVLIFLSYQVYTMNKVIAPVKDKSEGLIDDLNSFRNNNAAFASDLNEIREYLLLPTKDYASGESAQPTDDDLKAAILSFIGSVGHDADKIEKVKEIQTKVQSVVDSEEFKALMKDQGLLAYEFYPKYDGQNFYNFLALKIDELGPLAYVQANVVDGSFLVDSFAGQQQLGTEIGTNLIDLIKEKKQIWIDARKQILDKQKGFAEFFKTGEVAAFLKEKKLTFDAKYTDAIDAYVYKVDGPYGKVLDFGIAKQSGALFLYGVDKVSFASADEFNKALMDALKSADLRSPVEKLVEQKKNLLDGMFGEDSFGSFLQEFGGEISSEAKEEPDRYVYTLLRGGQPIGSIILEKGTAKIKVLRNGDGFAVDVFDYSSDSKKKI